MAVKTEMDVFMPANYAAALENQNGNFSAPCVPFCG
jgi:hypothetical protein